MRWPVIYTSDILAWADAYFARWRRWPARNSGPVSGQIDLTWCGIDLALRKGNRGLPGGSSLPQLLAEQRGVRNRMRLPRFSESQILTWADAFRRRTGDWPHADSGAVPELPTETWHNVDRGAVEGRPGLTRRLVTRPPPRLPPRRPKPVRAAGPHRRRSAGLGRHLSARAGRWPRRDDGPIPGAPGETWETVANAFYAGSRGLLQGSLASLLARRRGARYKRELPPLSAEQILGWAASHRRGRTGRWPTHTSGVIPEAPGETWGGIHSALRNGRRGFPNGSSLYLLLGEKRRLDRAARCGEGDRTEGCSADDELLGAAGSCVVFNGAGL